MTAKLCVFVSSVQKELEDERLIVQNLMNTDVFQGPGENIERLRVPEKRLLVTPAVEMQLNERQRKMMQWLTEGKELTSRQCEAEFGVTRPITAGDFGRLVEMGLAEKLGAGRSTRYRLKGLGESLSNRKAESDNRKPMDQNGGN
jgi:predicted HTH transcriptional regulator